MTGADKTFRDEIDGRFPYDDLDQCKRLIDRGIAISPYAAFAVLHEIFRPGRGVPVSADRLTQILEYWRSRFDHPAADMMREVASSMILGRDLPVDEVITRMGILAKYPRLSPALEILYFSCDDVEGRLEPLYEAIHERWAHLPPAAMDSNTNVIYIPLLDEGTEVVRPTLGVPLGSNLYRVLATPTYSRDDEQWKFPPGSTVRCSPEMKDGDEVLVAQELA